MIQSISTQTLQRLPTYLSCLRRMEKNGVTTVSAKSIAAALDLGEIQVRKDLALVSSCGRPKVGYLTESLIADIEQFLGYNEANDAVIVGAGKLGKALLSYVGFREQGLNIVAAFDSDPDVVWKKEGKVEILPMEKLTSFCNRLNVRIGIITVPAEYAQGVCDLLIDSGIMAIWNFAPTHLKTPEDIIVKNENMASSLAVLSKHLAEKLQK